MITYGCLLLWTVYCKVNPTIFVYYSGRCCLCFLENDILQSNRNEHIAHPSGEAFSRFNTGSSRAVSTSISVALYAAVVGQKLSHNTRHIYCLAQLSQWEQRVTYVCGERSPQALA
jgi:hypothetical protein